MNLDAVVRAVSAPYMRHLVRKHVASISGLENLPAHGSFVLVPNHTSYFDHFAVEMIVRAIRGTPVWFLTKQESFARLLPRAWARAWYGIPVDRDAPTPGTLREVRRVLTSSDALCVYPEGTRGLGSQLLPFKPGAFRFALSNNVPVIPLGMSGTETVLARGDRWFRRKGRADLAFGPALNVPTDGSASTKAEALSDEASAVVDGLKALAAAQRRDIAELGRNSVRELDRLITSTLDDAGTLSRSDIRRLRRVGQFFRATVPDDPGIKAQLLRLDGLAAPSALKLVFFMKALAIRVRAERIVRESPDEATAHYVLGRWHLGVPRVLGGSLTKSVEHFQAAEAAAAPGDTRAASGLADCYLALNDPERAVEALKRVLVQTADSQPRAARRRARAAERISAIAHQAPA